MSDELNEEMPRVLADEPELAVKKVGRAPKAVLEVEDPAAEKEREAAFNTEFEWQGKPLQPYSYSRESLFMQQRMAMGAPDIWRGLKDLDGFFPDAVRLLWLCSHEPKDWRALRAEPEELENAMLEWAELEIPRGMQVDACDLAWQIYAASRKNQHTAAPSERRANSDDSGN